MVFFVVKRAHNVISITMLLPQSGQTNTSSAGALHDGFLNSYARWNATVYDFPSGRYCGSVWTIG